MRTRLRPIDPRHPAAETLAEAAAVLRGGGLVAFPTETVYGLGANAADAAAVARVFAAKDRPAGNPLIVHVVDEASARALAADWPPRAAALAAAFWPGPLTLVVRRGEGIASAVAAGGATVAVRVPAHAVALGLLRACAMPIAAPSANRSSRVSPTRADHVLADLDGRVDLILDGGPTPGGLESTVLDVTVDPPLVLRPGLVTPSQIERVLGGRPVMRERRASSDAALGTGVLRSPGLLPKHYAPRALVVIAGADYLDVAGRHRDAGKRVAVLAVDRLAIASDHDLIALPADASSYARDLYGSLRALDARGVDVIVVERPPADEAWLAIHDRLRRAAADGEGQ